MIKNFPIQFQIIQNGTHNSPFQFGFSKTILSARRSFSLKTYHSLKGDLSLRTLR